MSIWDCNFLITIEADLLHFKQALNLLTQFVDTPKAVVTNATKSHYAPSLFASSSLCTTCVSCNLCCCHCFHQCLLLKFSNHCVRNVWSWKVNCYGIMSGVYMYVSWRVSRLIWERLAAFLTGSLMHSHRKNWGFATLPNVTYSEFYRRFLNSGVLVPQLYPASTWKIND